MIQTFTRFAAAASALALLPACGQSNAQSGDMTRAEVENIVYEYLLENPEVIEEALMVLRDRQRADEIAEARAAIVNNNDLIYSNAADYSIGPDDAEVTVVEFFDYRCGYCKRSVDYVAALPAANEGRVRVVFKELPILSPESRVAARAALAAGEQGKYFEMHVALMEARGDFSNSEIDAIAESVGVDVARMRADMDSTEVQTALSDSIALAQTLGISGTPAFIVGDTAVPGANTPMVDTLIQDALGD